MNNGVFLMLDNDLEATMMKSPHASEELGNINSSLNSLGFSPEFF